MAEQQHNVVVATSSSWRRRRRRGDLQMIRSPDLQMMRSPICFLLFILGQAVYCHPTLFCVDVAAHTCKKMRQSSRSTFNQPFFSWAFNIFLGQLPHFLVYVINSILTSPTDGTNGLL